MNSEIKDSCAGLGSAGGSEWPRAAPWRAVAALAAAGLPSASRGPASPWSVEGCRA